MLVKCCVWPRECSKCSVSHPIATEELESRDDVSLPELLTAHRCRGCHCASLGSWSGSVTLRLMNPEQVQRTLRCRGSRWKQHHHPGVQRAPGKGQRGRGSPTGWAQSSLDRVWLWPCGRHRGAAGWAGQLPTACRGVGETQGRDGTTGLAPASPGGGAGGLG